MAEFKFSLINLEGLEKLAGPINTLIEKISDAVTEGCSPWQKKRTMAAEVAADIMRAEGDAKVSEIQMRTRHRLLAEEEMRQGNIEDVIRQAIKFVAQSAKPEQMDDDWIIYFFEKCRIVSNAQLKMLWARVLAMEANLPGTVSKRTLFFLETMEKSDADLFGNLCRFIVGPSGSPLVLDPRQKIYRDNGVNSDSLSHLESIGLITITEWQLPNLMHWEGHLGRITYCGTTIELESKGIVQNTAILGTVAFTKIGKELASLCQVEEVSGFLGFILQRYKDHNCRIAGSNGI